MGVGSKEQVFFLDFPTVIVTNSNFLYNILNDTFTHHTIRIFLYLYNFSVMTVKMMVSVDPSSVDDDPLTKFCHFFACHVHENLRFIAYLQLDFKCGPSHFGPWPKTFESLSWLAHLFTDGNLVKPRMF